MVRKVVAACSKIIRGVVKKVVAAWSKNSRQKLRNSHHINLFALFIAYYFSEIKYTHENMDDDAHITNLQANLEMSADGLHNLQFYAREPLTDQQEYVRLQIYTGTYEYR